MAGQVDSSHYKFHRYITKKRWASMWHQLDEVIKLNPERVLEVGPGPGLFKATAGVMGVRVETLDLDPELGPDHVASVLDMPFRDGAFDVVCAFQMLEHLPFEQSVAGFGEMVRVASRAVIISLPDAATRWPVSFYVPKVGSLQFSVPKPRLRKPHHEFDGQHYWEINKCGYGLTQVTNALIEKVPVKLLHTFRVHENLSHRFFVFEILA